MEDARMAEKSVADKLCDASARGNLPEVLFLLQNGADVNGFNKYNRTALQVVKLGNSAVVKALLEAGAYPNLRDPVCGLTVMHDAAREGFADSVRVLVDHGADTNVVDDKGHLPLHLAAREGHLQVIRLLMGRTANPQKANGQGYTARQLALRYGRMDIVQYMDEYLSSH
ncbi:cyclin-dependent kinase 4 inhibitor C isoform X1 [Chaetodon auriga]|uniref:cyclin-dependent kinase 4 inhibitor C isoform X1 n=2 Tax=Chaetodon auriga TaxID=39042 RepID=UPI004032DDE7